MSKPLTESVLRRLTSEALVTYLGQAERFECRLRPGCCAATTGEQVADLNYIVAGHDANESGAFGAACETVISKSLPFLAILFPGAGPRRRLLSSDSSNVVDFPFMVREDAPVHPEGNDSIDVRRAAGPGAAESSAKVLSSGFGIPEDVVRRALPASLLDAPNVDVFLASIEDDVVGTVTVIHQGETAGIWSMATDPMRQRSGIGRRLLSTALADARTEGARRFFLGATPAGFRLYESLGFATRVVTQVWASGETHQT